MAVTIPKLNRIEPSSDISNGRINVQAQNNASSILSTTEALTSTVKQGVDIFTNYENDKIKEEGSKAELDYNAWYKDKLTGLKNNTEGDPTKLYNEFEQEAKQKLDSIMQGYSDVSSRVKDGISAYLGKTSKSLQLQMLHQRGMQQEVYSNNIFESSVKLKKDSLATNAGYIKKDDPSSYLFMDQGIADLKTKIAEHSISKGGAEVLADDAKEYDYAYKNDQGKIVKLKLGDIAKVRMAKETSEGVNAAITSMIASGYTEEAKQAYEKYQPYVDPKNQLTLKNKFKVEADKSEAFKIVGSIEAKPESEQMKAIEAIQDPQIKSEVLKIKDTNDARREHMRDRREKANFEVLAKNIMSKQSSDNPYHGLADLENDPIYKATWDKLDTKGRKAIQEMVKAPNETNPKAEIAMQNLIFGNDPNNSIETISPEEFSKYTVGLNKADKNKYTGMYNRMRTQSSGQERAMYKQAGDMLRDQFLIDGHVERDRFGKISGDDEITLLKAKQKLIDHLNTQQGNMDQKQLKDFVKQFSAAEIKGKVFNPTPKPMYNATPNQNNAVTPTKAVQSSPAQIVISPKDKVQYKKSFHDAYGYFPTDTDEKFKNFIQKKVSSN